MSIATETLALDTSTILTLSSDEITITRSFHVVAAESGTADDLATINLGSLGFVPNSLFVLLQADSGDTITVKDGTGNINLNGGADFDLSGEKTLLLFYDGTNWADTGAGGSGGGGVTSVGVSTDASYLEVGSSPVTTSGTITLNKTDSLTANQVVATPDGVAGKADLRALVSDDLPTVPVTKGGTGKTSITSGVLLIGNGTSAPTEISGTTQDDIMIWDDVGSDWEASQPVIRQLASGNLVSSSATISISSIPATYRDLRLVITVRSDFAATNANLYIRANSDTTAANYFSQYVAGTGAAGVAQENNGSTASITNVNVPGATSPSNTFAGGVYTFHNYASASYVKTVTGILGHRFTTGASSNVIYTSSGIWNSTAALNAITLALSAGSFVAGTSYTLYGLN